MKYAVFGAVLFILGAASSPRAANDNETLSLLCERFKASGAQGYIDTSRKLGDAKVHGKLPKFDFDQEDRATFRALEFVRAMVCVK